MYEFAIDDSIKAMSLITKGKKAIALNKNILCGKADEASVLAEELGHFDTGAFYAITPCINTPIGRSNRIKCEGVAKGWAYREYCAPDEIEMAHRQEGVYGDYAMAEYWQVTVDFLQRAIEYHRSCGVVFSFDNDNYDSA